MGEPHEDIMIEHERQHRTTTRQIAEAFGISLATACRLASEADSPALRVGGSWRWPSIDQVMSWLQQRTDELREARTVEHNHHGR